MQEHTCTCSYIYFPHTQTPTLRGCVCACAWWGIAGPLSPWVPGADRTSSAGGSYLRTSRTRGGGGGWGDFFTRVLRACCRSMEGLNQRLLKSTHQNANDWLRRVSIVSCSSGVYDYCWISLTQETDTVYIFHNAGHYFSSLLLLLLNSE